VYDGVIYHCDLVYHSLADRQLKIERYDRLAPGNRVGLLYSVPDELSFPDSAGSLLPIPFDDLPFQPSAEREQEPLLQLSSQRRYEFVPLDDIRRAHLWRSDVETFQEDPRIFRAELTPINLPVSMAAGEIYWVDVLVSNRSPLMWPSPGSGIPDVIVTYHWLRDPGDSAEFHGLQTRLPHTLRPGEMTRIPVQVQAPVESGEYLLQWDLLIEQVAWFSTRGWEAPCSSIRVLDDTSSALQSAARAVYERRSGAS
jgi:hypothetical protein